MTLVASGSVLLGRPSATNSPTDVPPFSGICSGDDWDCYRPAQQNLLGMLARKEGCVVVLTGDYHYADIKRIIPGEDAPYQDVYMPPVRPKVACPCVHDAACMQSSQMVACTWPCNGVTVPQHGCCQPAVARVIQLAGPSLCICEVTRGRGRRRVAALGAEVWSQVCRGCRSLYTR